MQKMLLAAVFTAIVTGAVYAGESAGEALGISGLTAVQLDSLVPVPAAAKAAAGSDTGAGLPAGEMNLVGGWKNVSGGTADSITFEIEDGQRIFRSYLHDRPMEFGTWRLEGEKLFINSPLGETQYVKVGLKGNILTLLRADGAVETYSGII